MRWLLFVGTVQSILFLGHWFFYRTLVRFFDVSGPSKLLPLRIALGLLSISLVLTSFLSFRYSSLPVRSVYMAAASWLGMLYLFILAAILCWVFYGLARLFHLPLDRKILIEILIAIALLGSLYGFINSGSVRTTRISISLANLPSHWKGKRAVWVSDTHLGQVRSVPFSRRIADMVQSLHPDIVFIGGDLYDGVAVDLDKVIEPLSRISSQYGTYFITGNHEEFSDKSRYLEAIRRAKIRVLDNEMVDLDGLQIIGVDYRDSSRSEQFKTILQRMAIDRRRPSILLKHAPLNLPIAEEQGISVQLSGHTHHGQVFLFRFITSKVYQGYDYGMRWFDNLLVYTSSGAGTWGPPMRIDTRPEIVLITFV